MFEITSSTHQFVSTAYPNDRLRGGNFGVSFGLDKVFTLSFFLLMHFSLGCNQKGKECTVYLYAPLEHTPQSPFLEK